MTEKSLVDTQMISILLDGIETNFTTVLQLVYMESE